MKYQMVFAFLALCIGAESANDVYTADNNPARSVNLGQAINMYYQAFKKVMPCGFAPYNMPVLAPITINHWDFYYDSEWCTLKGNLSNTVITGMNNFRLLGGSYNTTTQRLTYDVAFNQVQILGEYEFDLDAMVVGFPYKTAGKGLLNDSFIDFRVLGEFTLAPSIYNASGLRISNFSLNFYFGDITANNLNNLWDNLTNSFANEWIRDFGLMWTEEIQVQVDELYAQLILPIVNGYLESMDMSDLIDLFVGQAQSFNMADCKLV